MRKSLIAALMLSLLMIGGSTGVSSAAAGPIPGCNPAVHVTFKGPWDGGPWYFPTWSSKRPALRLAIVHTWANLNADSVKNHPRNPGQPPWNQTLVKTMISPAVLQNLDGVKARLFGLGGEAWIYPNTRACRHNIRFEFRNGDMPVRSLGTLADEGLAYIY